MRPASPQLQIHSSLQRGAAFRAVTRTRRANRSSIGKLPGWQTLKRPVYKADARLARERADTSTTT